MSKWNHFHFFMNKMLTSPDDLTSLFSLVQKAEWAAAAANDQDYCDKGYDPNDDANKLGNAEKKIKKMPLFLE